MTKQWYTTQEVADRLGLNVSRVRKLAGDLGIGQQIGRNWAFTDADIAALRARPDRRTKEARRQDDAQRR